MVHQAPDADRALTLQLRVGRHQRPRAPLSLDEQVLVLPKVSEPKDGTPTVLLRSEKVPLAPDTQVRLRHLEAIGRVPKDPQALGSQLPGSAMRIQ